MCHLLSLDKYSLSYIVLKSKCTLKNIQKTAKNRLSNLIAKVLSLTPLIVLFSYKNIWGKRKKLRSKKFLWFLFIRKPSPSNLYTTSCLMIQYHQTPSIIICLSKLLLSFNGFSVVRLIIHGHIAYLLFKVPQKEKV